MKKFITIICVLAGAILFTPLNVSAAVSFVDGRWSTTFDYPECTQRGGGGAVDCGKVQTDGITWNWGADSVDGHFTEVASAANNPDGAGGNGFRAWVGDGTNIQTGFARIDFPSPQKEVWLRWYIRYEPGFSWSSIKYDKMMWVYTGSPGSNRIPAVVPEWNGDTYAAVSQGTGDDYQLQSSSEYGWTWAMGGNVSDGRFHCVEVYLKMDNGNYDGAGRVWIDGILVAENTATNWSGGNTTAQEGFTWIEFYGNQAYPANGKAAYVDFDDLEFYNNTPPNTDPKGNPYIGTLDVAGSLPASPPPPEPEPVTVLFEESFTSSNLAINGWYDNTDVVISTTETAPGSSSSVEYYFATGAPSPSSGGAMRKKFDPTDAVYVSYYVKYSNNWVGSNRNYHPHEFYLMTNKDDDWVGMAYTHLTAYIEQNALKPRIALQDGQNIDLANLNRNLVGVTENRAVAGCNGDSDGYGDGSCYAAGGGLYWNSKHWETATPAISAGTWHKVEAYIKLNSVVDGIGVADGISHYWLDGKLLISRNDVVYRTGQHPDMLFDKFVIAPWIGDGSPVDQAFWVDNLVVATAPPDGQILQIQPPTGLRIIYQN